MIAARPCRLAAAALGLAAGCLSKPGIDCELDPGPFTLEASLGTDGGIPASSATVCSGGLVVGVGLTLSQEPHAAGEKTAISVTLRCAPMSHHNGDYAPGDRDDVAVPGGSHTSLEGPFFADCPRGQAVIGLAAHLIAPTSLFNSLAIDCSRLDPSGAPTGTPTRILQLATGARAPDTEVRCDRGVLLGLKPWSGRDLDRVQLACGRPTCAKTP
ncbi:MAG TPA: hypothetical protein VK932_26585 [Kofleriaceae bacterium]|nr:hypothetical protein [Kofleriaceae bacterium]